MQVVLIAPVSRPVVEDGRWGIVLIGNQRERIKWHLLCREFFVNVLHLPRKRRVFSCGKDVEKVVTSHRSCADQADKGGEYVWTVRYKRFTAREINPALGDLESLIDFRRQESLSLSQLGALGHRTGAGEA